MKKNEKSIEQGWNQKPSFTQLISYDVKQNKIKKENKYLNLFDVED